MSRHTIKWRVRTAAATEDYVKGIKETPKSWAKCTCEAEDSYKAGVDAAHVKASMRKAVQKLGQQGFLQKTLTKGPTRYAQGVAEGGDAFAEGFKPYRNAFAGITLPVKYPKRDPRNLDRCKAVCTAMGKTKVELAGAGKVTCPED